MVLNVPNGPLKSSVSNFEVEQAIPFSRLQTLKVES